LGLSSSVVEGAALQPIIHYAPSMPQVFAEVV
jgi:hypothetical protein